MPATIRTIRSAGNAGRIALCAFAALSLFGAFSSRAAAQQPDEKTTPPQLIHKTEPEYTAKARDAHIEGTVLLEVRIGKDGNVEGVRVKRSLDKGLDENAMVAALRWKFKPGTRDGEPVAVSAVIEVNFRLT